MYQNYMYQELYVSSILPNKHETLAYYERLVATLACNGSGLIETD